MKVETPQILWHGSSEGNGKPAPIYSISLLPQRNPKDGDDSHVLATAGNSNEVHLWKVTFGSSLTLAAPNNASLENPLQPVRTRTPMTTAAAAGTKTMRNLTDFVTAAPGASAGGTSTNIQHVTSLTRPHERSINVLSFSPRGTFLASAGDGATLAIYSHSLSSWHHVNDENQVQFRPLRLQMNGNSVNEIMDVSWSKDEKRLVLGTLDHGVILIENGQNSQPMSGDWKMVWTNFENKQYVQGVAFDPLNVYLASQGSDRTVRVWSRKKPNPNGNNNSKKSQAISTTVNASTCPPQGTVDWSSSLKQSNMKAPLDTTAFTNSMVGETQGKFDVGKAKIIRYAPASDQSTPSNDPLKEKTMSTELQNTLQVQVQVQEQSHQQQQQQHQQQQRTTNSATKKYHLFADESTVECFFRRLAWTADGAFLITPACLWHRSNDVRPEGESSSPTFATCLFARHHFDSPYMVLSGLDKPSVVVCPNPVHFKLPSLEAQDSKENSPSFLSNKQQVSCPYRSVFAVLTLDSVIIYDTYHGRPLCIARGHHYASLTDGTWSEDGHNLMVSSNDGYISILSFSQGEFGEVYTLSPKKVSSALESSSQQLQQHPMTQVSGSSVTLVPCEPGSSAVIVGPPSKKLRIAPTLVSSVTPTGSSIHDSCTVKETKASLDMLTESRVNQTTRRDLPLEEKKLETIHSNKNNPISVDVMGGVTNLSLDHENEDKNKNTSNSNTHTNELNSCMSKKRTSHVDGNVIHMEEVTMEEKSMEPCPPALKKQKKRIPLQTLSVPIPMSSPIVLEE